jgi:uncharacterized membrane protein
VFSNQSFLKWIVIFIILLVGSCSVLYFFSLRKLMEFKTRSPWLMVLGVIFLMGDSVSYTFVFSGDSDADDWQRKCGISTISTCLFFLGMMMVYFLRMFRIFRVYTFYNKYLTDQMKDV